MKINNKLYRLFFVIPFLILSLSSCGSIKKFLNIAKDESIPSIVLRVSYEDAWKEIFKTVSKDYPIFLEDKKKGMIETEKFMEFSLENQYKQYVQLSVRVKKVEENFTAVTADMQISRYSPVFYDWYSVSAEKREKDFLEIIKANLGKK